jgi:tetratricopeptide (TPR) repeat protein
MPTGYRLEPSPEVSSLAAGPVSPGAEALLDAAILFSGAGPSRAREAKDRGLVLLAEARGLAVSEPDEYSRGRIVLDIVHAIISSYSELETRLDAALLDGRYNCVGSSTLYAILARTAGLDVRGVILPDHAYCYLLVDGRRVDVETTVPDGYDATVHRLVSGSAKGVDTGLRGVVALALRNRATLLERAGRWPEALALAVDAYAYASGGLAEGGRADQFSWDTLAGRVNNAVAGLLNAGRHAEALAVVDRAIGLYGADDGFVELRKAARTGSLASEIRKASPAGALLLADQALLAGDIGTDVLESAFAYAYTALAEERRQSGDHLGAWEVAVEAQRRFPRSASLASLAGTARANWVISVHNSFAALYNAGRYAEAIAVVEEALELVPGERRLVDDLAAARKVLP